MNSILSNILVSQVFFVTWLTSGLPGFLAILIVLNNIGWGNAFFA